MRIGQSTGTTGTPTITAFTRHDLWLEYESAARNWWRNGWRPGQTVTHCHPAYLYGGGLMLSGTLEYFGFLNLWVPPPDTDELAEQAIRVWQRIHPDMQMVTLSQHRFQEVAAKLGIDLQVDCGFPAFSMGGFGRGLMPLMTAGIECYAYLGGADSTCDGAHIHEDWAIVQAIDPATGRRRARGPVGQPRRHHARPRQRPAALRPRRGGDARVGRLPARRDEPARLLGRPVQGPAQQPGRPLPGVGPREGGGIGQASWPSPRWSSSWSNRTDPPIRSGVRVEVGADEGAPSDDRRAQLADQVGDAVRSMRSVSRRRSTCSTATRSPRSGYKLKRVVAE